MSQIKGFINLEMGSTLADLRKSIDKSLKFIEKMRGDPQADEEDKVTAERARRRLEDLRDLC